MLALESIQEDMNNMPDGDVPNVDAGEVTQETSDVTDIALAAQDGEATVAKQEEVAETLDDANPEEQQAAAVEAQVNLEHFVSRITKARASEYLRRRGQYISTEDMIKSPLSSFQIAHEGLVDMVKTVARKTWEFIKNIFKKLKDFIASLFKSKKNKEKLEDAKEILEDKSHSDTDRKIVAGDFLDKKFENLSEHSSELFAAYAFLKVDMGVEAVVNKWMKYVDKVTDEKHWDDLISSREITQPETYMEMVKRPLADVSGLIAKDCMVLSSKEYLVDEKDENGVIHSKKVPYNVEEVLKNNETAIKTEIYKALVDGNRTCDDLMNFGYKVYNTYNKFNDFIQGPKINKLVAKLETIDFSENTGTLKEGLDQMLKKQMVNKYKNQLASVKVSMAAMLQTFNFIFLTGPESVSRLITQYANLLKKSDGKSE